MKSVFKKSTEFIKMHRRLDVLFLSLALAVFLAITLGNITNASFWFDEAFSSYIIQFNFVEIANYTATDVHPPLYYWALKLWSELFGTTELALRSLSVAFGAATIAVTYFTTRHLFGRKIAAVALVFLALSPMLIRYSDEARMYTVAAFLVVSATAVLIKATSSNQKRWWVLYGVLVSLGMWTHYFTALAWLAHWAWRAGDTHSKRAGIKQNIKKFFSKQWVLAYSVAVLLFVPWMVFMVRQLTVVQSSGFWIGPVSVDTPSNYMTNIFYYLEHGQVQSWLAVAFLIAVVAIVIATPLAIKKMTATERKWFGLYAALAWVPPILLFIASLPPLRPSFVERYLIPATVAFAVFAAIVLVIGTRRWKPVLRALPIILIVGMMIFGITNVYKYGNYNKNTNTHIVTRQLVEQIQEKAKPGEPIIATSPWLFYETIPYTTSENPIYFIDANTQYIYGSLDMLESRDQHKIKDMDAFAKANPVIWYLGQAESGDIAPYETSWQKIQTVGVYDSLTNKTSYRATQYNINAE